MIEAVALTRKFGARLAVDGLTTSVPAQGLFGLLGPNGAGKTTTMRLLTAFLAPTSGAAVVAGFDLFEAPESVKAHTGYLPEHPPLHLELTVGEYLRFVAEIRGVPRGERLRRVGSIMDEVGLARFERRLIGTLSKGYRQRVGIAQAIVHDPRLLLLDEPTSGLDPVQVVGIRALVRRLAETRTVVLSTHVLAEVSALCERVLLLHRGRLVGDGTVAELAERAGQGPWLGLEVTPTEPDLAPALAALDAVREVTLLGPGRYRLRGDMQALAPAVAALAVRADRAVHALVVHGPELEPVFLSLVASGEQP